MFGIGGFELFIILIFGFLIFGPEKLPEIARTVGKGIARFREAQQEMNDTLGSEKIFDPNNPDEPFKDPIEALDKLAARQEEKRRAKESASGENPASKADTAAGNEKAPSKNAASAAGSSASAAAHGDDSAPSEQPRQESFTERKARYERERAARKAAEAADAKAARETPAADGLPEDKPTSPETGAVSEGGDE